MNFPVTGAKRSEPLKNWFDSLRLFNVRLALLGNINVFEPPSMERRGVREGERGERGDKGEVGDGEERWERALSSSLGVSLSGSGNSLQNDRQLSRSTKSSVINRSNILKL